MSNLNVKVENETLVFENVKTMTLHQWVDEECNRLFQGNNYQNYYLNAILSQPVIDFLRGNTDDIPVDLDLKMGNGFSVRPGIHNQKRYLMFYHNEEFMFPVNLRVAELMRNVMTKCDDWYQLTQIEDETALCYYLKAYWDFNEDRPDWKFKDTTETELRALAMRFDENPTDTAEEFAESME